MITRYYDEMNFVFVTAYYDGPISGLCKENNQLMSFIMIDDSPLDYYLYELFPLTKLEKFKWLLRKWAFEFCIGFHASYYRKGRNVFYHKRKPEFIHNFLFKIYYKIIKKISVKGS